MIHASSGTGYSTSPKGKSRKQPPAPLLSPTLTSTPTTPDVGDERAIATVVGGNEVMNQQNSSTNLSGLASPAKAGSGMSYISSSAQQPNRASIRPSRQSPSTSSVQSRFSLYNRAVPESARAIYGASPSSVSQTYSAGSSSLPSRHLITVIPPNTLPHDPPHPRANPQASGYGTPENFKSVLSP